MTGFLQDPTQPETVARLLDKMKASANCTWFALVDTAFDYENGGFGLFAPFRTNCYEGVLAIEGLMPAAPYLIVLDPARWLEQVQELVTHCDSRPMLSFLSTKRNTGVADLVNQWSGLHSAEGEEGDRYLLRFADTRSLEHLPHVLKPRQWQSWHQNVLVWCTINRRGGLTELPLPKEGGRMPDKTQLSHEQFNQFLELAEPDSLLNLIDQEMPQYLEGKSGSGLYELAERSTRKLFQANIEDRGDRTLFLVSVLETDGKLLDAPELDGFLKSVQPAQLDQMLMQQGWFKALKH